MFKRLAVAAAVAGLAIAAPAQARDGYYRHHRGGDDAAIAIGAGVVGLALGAALASGSRDRDYYYYDDSYYYPRGYYYNSYPRYRQYNNYYYRSYPRQYWRGDRDRRWRHSRRYNDGWNYRRNYDGWRGYNYGWRH